MKNNCFTRSVFAGALLIFASSAYAACPYDSENYAKSVAQKFYMKPPASLVDKCIGSFLNNITGGFSFDIGNFSLDGGCDVLKNLFDGENPIQFTGPTFEFSIESNTSADDFILPY